VVIEALDEGIAGVVHPAGHKVNAGDEKAGLKVGGVDAEAAAQVGEGFEPFLIFGGDEALADPVLAFF